MQIIIKKEKEKENANSIENVAWQHCVDFSTLKSTSISNLTIELLMGDQQMKLL